MEGASAAAFLAAAGCSDGAVENINFIQIRQLNVSRRDAERPRAQRMLGILRIQ